MGGEQEAPTACPAGRGTSGPATKASSTPPGRSTGLPQQAGHKNHVWAWDFVSDYTERGGKLRTFNLIDEYTRECRCIHADRAIKAADVLALLQEAIARHGPPKYIRSDNGPEFIAKVIQTWLRDNHIQTIYIESGCPWQNGDAESFNGPFRAECLNRELLYTLSESRVVFEDWRSYYNDERPHRSLGLQTPAKFAEGQPLKAPTPVGLRPPYTGAFKRNERRQTNRKLRKLSHKEWAKMWGPTRGNRIKSYD